MDTDVIVADNPGEDAPLDGYHAHEVLDRLHIVLCMIDDHLLDHKYVDAYPDLQRLIGTASRSLADAYQIVGAQHLMDRPPQ